MKSIFSIICFIFIFGSSVFAQNDTIDSDPRKKVYGIGWFHKKNQEIYGISFGLASVRKPINTITNGIRFEALGFGLLGLIGAMAATDLNEKAGDNINHGFSFEVDEAGQKHSELTNGISFSVLGDLGLNDVNGIGINGITCMNRRSNGLFIEGVFHQSKIGNGVFVSGAGVEMNEFKGLAVSTIINKVHTGKGVNICLINNGSRNFSGLQISLYNRAKTGRLIQLGLVNYIKDNPKWLRVLPLINMRFAKKDSFD